MIVKTVRTNAVSVVYEMLSEEGKVVNKRQTFDFVSYTATDENFHELGRAIGDILAYSPKEILKNNVALLVEE